MPYISPANEYPRYIGDVQLESPSYQEGDELPSGWKKVVEITPPETQADEKLEELFPMEIDGVWTQNWLVRPMTDEEKALRDAPKTAKAKLLELGLTEAEIFALMRGRLR